MKSHHVLLSLSLFCAWLGSVVAAPPEGIPKAATSHAPQASSFLRVFRPYTGNPILVVDYPWQVFSQPSLEVQWLPDDQPEPVSSRPLGFVSGFLKGEFAVEVERCRTAAERIGLTTTTTQDDIDFEVNAQRNSLSKPAAWVVFHLKRPDDTLDTRTAFCLLESWALDRRTLYLDLPPKYYAQPGKLRVWMLRGKDTVWMASIAWPGIPGATDEETVQAAGFGAKWPTTRKPAKAGESEDAASAAGKKAGGGTKPAPAAGPAPAKRPSKAGKKAEDAADDDPFAAPKPAKKE